MTVCFKALKLTRVGDFRFGADGYLVDGKGNPVYGFMNTGVDAKGNPQISDQLVPIRLPKAGELQSLEAGGIRARDGRGCGLVAHQEEAVAIEHAVHGVAGRIVARGHIQIDAGHLRAVADLRGVLTAGGGGAVRAAAVHGVQGVTENRALGFIAVCIDVGDVVAHHIQLAHVAFQARDRRIHCSGHLFC